MKNLVFCLLFIFSGVVGRSQECGHINNVPAFPGAEGAGKYTVGGRGGQVYVVTNLNDKGEGSLRKGIQRKGARTIVFVVSGTIRLETPLTINNDSITIAGQSAPGKGICLSGHGLKVSASEVIIRYIRIRPGDEFPIEQDAITGMGNKNIIIDHCSFSWGTDEACSFYKNENLTIQWCIMSESLNMSHHFKGEHGYGGIWGGNKATFYHNLLAHHTSRNPRFQGSRGLTSGEEELTEMVNNVIYNWRSKASYGGENGKYNLIGNYYKPGPATVSKERILFLEPYKPLGKYYLSGNILEGAPAVNKNNQKGINPKSGSLKEIVVGSPFMVSDIKPFSAQDAFNAVINNAGASLNRDEVDRRILNEVRTGTTTYGENGIINSQKDVGGWPDLSGGIAPADTDGDGMPDEWEIENGLDPNNSTDHRGYNLHQQYTNLEMYLNGIVAK